MTPRHSLLVQLLARAHEAGEPVGPLLSAALAEVAETLPRGAETLVEADPDGWQADHIRALVNGELGWPDQDPLDTRPDLHVVDDDTEE